MTERELGLLSTSEGATPDRSFDELAKGLADGTLSRGRALRLMGAALVGAAAASISGVAWAAPPEGRGRPCPKGEIKCRNTCCGPEDLCCRGACTNVSFNRLNCGRCGKECAEGEDCCTGRCVPLNTTEHCSGCFAGCHPAEICVNGTCQCPRRDRPCALMCAAQRDTAFWTRQGRLRAASFKRTMHNLIRYWPRPQDLKVNSYPAARMFMHYH